MAKRKKVVGGSLRKDLAQRQKERRKRAARRRKNAKAQIKEAETHMNQPTAVFTFGDPYRRATPRPTVVRSENTPENSMEYWQAEAEKYKAKVRDRLSLQEMNDARVRANRRAFNRVTLAAAIVRAMGSSALMADTGDIANKAVGLLNALEAIDRTPAEDRD